MANLSEVFGIAASVPTYTYVDRAGLDAKFQYLLASDKHLVIYGASKQGKTSLRRKCLPEDQSIVVRCHADSNLQQIYEEILRQLHVSVPTQFSRTFSVEGNLRAQGSLEVGIPKLAKGTTELGGSVTAGHESGRLAQPIGQGAASLGFVAERINSSRKRCVIEDFHYLPEDEKTKFAFDLKAFWDASVFFIVVGIWAEQNLLTYYNGDLSGRVEEIDVQWTDNELLAVLDKGERALNINLGTDIRHAMVRDASKNVGLLQRLAEKYCYACNVLATSDQPCTLANMPALESCRTHVCREESARYRQFSDAVVRGFRERDGDGLQVYLQIMRVLIEASDAELVEGIASNVLLARVQKYEPKIRQSDLSAALNRIDKLQADRSVSPLVISYNPNIRRVQLVDRELLFYRKYGNPSWPWQGEDLDG